MAASPRVSVPLCLLALLSAQGCAHLGHNSEGDAGKCTRSQAQRDAVVASARILSDTGGSNLLPSSRRPWPFLGAAPSEIHLVDDDQVCRRVLGALHSAHGVKADSVAAAKVRGAYVVFVIPSRDATYVLDRELRVLDVLIVPS